MDIWQIFWIKQASTTPITRGCDSIFFSAIITKSLIAVSLSFFLVSFIGCGLTSILLHE